MTDNIHNMTTRSKARYSPLEGKEETFYDTSDIINEHPDDDEIDEYGNLKGLIDYECNEKLDKKELNKQLKIISRSPIHNSPKHRKFKFNIYK